MCHAGNILDVARLKPDMMGFIFYPFSPRYAGSISPEVMEMLPDEIERTGVFVNEDRKVILCMVSLYNLHTLQLHGDESPEECFQLRDSGCRVIKAIRVGGSEDIGNAVLYENACDGLLFDASGTKRGGMGVPFDWALLNHYTGKLPFLLSGGISAKDVEKIGYFSRTGFVGIDLNSRFEIVPGVKDIRMLGTFIKKIRMMNDK